MTRRKTSRPTRCTGTVDGNLNGESLPTGEYTLTATAYAERGLGGAVLGTLAVSFTVTGPATEEDQNTPATGAPTISGDAYVGETLTADVSAIVDADGLPELDEFSYQWIRHDGTTDAGIAGATDSTYTLVEADEGNAVKVRVGFTDDASNPEELTSGATAFVVPPPEVTFIEGEEPITAFQAVALISNTGVGTDEDFNTDGAAGQQFTTGSNAQGYTLTGVDILVDDSDSFSASVCTVDADGFPTSTCTALTAPADFAPATLSFTAPSNTVLTSGTTYTVHIEPGSTFVRLETTDSNDEDSGGATGWSIADGFDWEHPTLGWRTTATGESIRIAVKGAAVFEVVPPGEIVWSATLTVGDVITGAVGYSGSNGSLTSKTFTAETTEYTVKRIILFTTTDGTFSLTLDQELQSDFRLYAGTVGLPKSDATSTTLQNGDQVYQWEDHGLSWSAGDTVKMWLTVNTEPTGEPTITGDDPPQVGERLTADISAIMDDDGLPEPDEFSYQWVRVVADATEADIEGARLSSYAPLVADIGKTIKVRVSYTDDADFKETLTSDATAAVTPSPYGEVIWSATMTVEEFMFGGRTYFGYTNFNNRGSIEPITFSYGGATITALSLFDLPGDHLQVEFENWSSTRFGRLQPVCGRGALPD